MASTTTGATTVLDEAAAIVEAEWIRLQHDEALWQRELAARPADHPAPRPAPPTVAVATTGRRWPAPPSPAERRRSPIRPRPATPVWATQRSPPRGPGRSPPAGNDFVSTTMMPRSRHRFRLPRPDAGLRTHPATRGGLSEV